jgi:hypothetical protein
MHLYTRCLALRAAGLCNSQVANRAIALDMLRAKLLVVMQEQAAQQESCGVVWCGAVPVQCGAVRCRFMTGAACFVRNGLTLTMRDGFCFDGRSVVARHGRSRRLTLALTYVEAFERWRHMAALHGIVVHALIDVLKTLWHD